MVSEALVTRYAPTTDGVHVPYQMVGEKPRHVLMVTDGPAPVDVLWEEPSLVHIRNRLRSFSTTVWCGAVGWESPTEIAAVYDAVGVSEMALVAIGYAGGAAISYAASHPERVSSLILVNTFAYYGQDSDFPWGWPADELAEAAAVEAESLLEGASGLVFDLIAPSRVSDERLRRWFGRARRLYAGRELTSSPAVSVLQTDHRPVLGMLQVPTLVLHRQGNRFIRVEAGRYLAEHISGAKYVELPGSDHLFFAGDVDGLVDEIEEFLTGSHQPPEGDVVISMVAFTDIVNSTDQQSEFGHRAWTRLMDAHDALVRSALQRHRGREIKTTGDGFLMIFDGASRAVRCVMEVVTEARHIGLDLRAGLHIGEMELRGPDVAGLAVTIAKRVCDSAGPGEVLVSSAVPIVVAGSDIRFSYRGEEVLKGVPGVWQLYSVVA